MLLGVVPGYANAVATRFRSGFKLLKGRDDRCGAGVGESRRDGLCPTGGLWPVAKDRIGYLSEVLADVPDIDDFGDGDAGYAQKRGGMVPDPIRTVSQHHHVPNLSAAHALLGRLSIDAVKEVFGILQAEDEPLSAWNAERAWYRGPLPPPPPVRRGRKLSRR